MHKGQSSIELLSILSVALLVLGIIMATSRSAYEDMQISLDSDMVESSLLALAHNTELAYNSGPGTVLKTSMHIPSTVERDGCYIANGIINVQLLHKYGVKDIPQTLSVPVKTDFSFSFKTTDFFIFFYT